MKTPKILCSYKNIDINNLKLTNTFSLITLHSTLFKIQLPQFEGPFDLLLFFIERDELDIYDIPIAKVTKDFLEYIQVMTQMDMEVAAEFILVAGTLMRIKVKMLLPRPEINEKGEEIDPREELVSRLLAYKKYKSVLEEWGQMEDDMLARVQRGFLATELKSIAKVENPIEDLSSLDAYTLLKIFQKVWERHEYEIKKPRHVIQQYPYKMDDIRQEIKEAILVEEKIEFVSFVMRNPNKIYFVFSFLAILELTQEKVIRLSVGEGFNQFWLIRREDGL